MARQENTNCVNCNKTLPDRYKGREKKYCDADCRKEYIKTHETKA